MPTDRTFHIRPALDGQTLAAGLRRLVPDLSWNDAKQLITSRRVHINGNLTLDDARRLKAGDVVKLFEHARAPVPTDKDVRVLYVDSDLIVVDKPAGITTLRHAEEKDWDDQRKQRQPTLDEVLQKMLPTLRPTVPMGQELRPASPPAPRGHPLHARQPQPPKGGKPSAAARGRHPLHKGPPPQRGGSPPNAYQSMSFNPNAKVRPVHRLDRDTSGLMIFALSPRAEQKLVEMFKAHEIQRLYWAVAVGRAEAGRIESYITRDRGDGLRGSTPRGAEDPEAKVAITHIRVLEHLGDDYTIIECRLETGRTHQIRIHLSESGHMLCGEKVYNRAKPGAEPIRDPSGAPRHALHSHDLTFDHPITGRPMHFASPPPRELAQWVEKLRGRRENG